MWRVDSTLSTGTAWRSVYISCLLRSTIIYVFGPKSGSIFFCLPSDLQSDKKLRSTASTANMAQKTVFITGCSEGGIGDALAKTFHKKGIRVFASARNTAKAQHLKDMGLDILRLDVTDEKSIRQAVETVKAATGGTLDFLVNNSGGGESQELGAVNLLLLPP